MPFKDSHLPIIGHIKKDHRIERNFLKGDALMAAAAFSFKKALKEIKNTFIFGLTFSKLIGR